MLKKNSATPLYSQLVSALIDYIKTNLSIDEKMLSEREICEKYDVSRTTVRAALNELEEMGFVYRHHGKGTYVSGLCKEMNNLSDAYSFTDHMKKLGKKPQTDIVSFGKISAIAYVAKNMGIPPGDEVYKLRRLRKADGMTMMVETTFIPVVYFQDLNLKQHKSIPLYELYPKLYDQEIKFADEEFFASIVQKKRSRSVGNTCRFSMFKDISNNLQSRQQDH